MDAKKMNRADWQLSCCMSRCFHNHHHQAQQPLGSGSSILFFYLSSAHSFSLSLSLFLKNNTFMESGKRYKMYHLSQSIMNNTLTSLILQRIDHILMRGVPVPVRYLRVLVDLRVNNKEHVKYFIKMYYPLSGFFDEDISNLSLNLVVSPEKLTLVIGKFKYSASIKTVKLTKKLKHLQYGLSKHMILRDIVRMIIIPLCL